MSTVRTGVTSPDISEPHATEEHMLFLFFCVPIFLNLHAIIHIACVTQAIA